MSYYDIYETENKIIVVNFHTGLPIGSQGGNASPHFELKERIKKIECIGIICDISNSDYEYGDYVSAVWIVGIAAKKRTCVVARDEQILKIKSLMKLSFEVPILSSMSEAIHFIISS